MKTTINSLAATMLTGVLLVLFLRGHAVADATATPASPTAEQIFENAWNLWNDREAPPFVAFSLPCSNLGMGGSPCGSSTLMRIFLRTSDGSACASPMQPDGTLGKQFIPSGGRLFGPGGAPLAFVKTVRKTNHAVVASPFNSDVQKNGVRNIATVRAVARSYEIVRQANDTINGVAVYHLTFTPIDSPSRYPLRELWVNQQSGEIVRLSYELPWSTGHAIAIYDFGQTKSGVWWITHIDGSVPVTGFLGRSHLETMSESLEDIVTGPTLPPTCWMSQNPSGG